MYKLPQEIRVNRTYMEINGRKIGPKKPRKMLMKIAKMPDGKSEIYNAVQGEGLTQGKPIVFVRQSMCNLACKWCWTAGTKVLMADGTEKNIENVKKGELVKSYKDGKVFISAVQDISNREVDEIVELDIDGIHTGVTPDHNYYVCDYGAPLRLVEAKDLENKVVYKYDAKASKLLQNKDYQLGYLAGMAEWSSESEYGFNGINLYLKTKIPEVADRIRKYAGTGAVLVGDTYNVKLQGVDAKRVLEALPTNAASAAGRLAAIIDTEKYCTLYRGSCMFTTLTAKQARRIAALLDALDLNYMSSEAFIEVTSGRDSAKLISECMPVRASDGLLFGQGLLDVAVEEVTPKKGKFKVYSIQTTAGNCFVNGILAEQCDSYYTWYFKGDTRPHDFAEPVDPKDYIKDMTPEEVAADINEARRGHRNVLFTGGEPLLQYKFILEVIDILKQDGSDEWYFEIETNGTIKMPLAIAEQLDQINSSPKLNSSGNCSALRDKPEAIATFLEHYNNGTVSGLCFKFVVMLETWEKDMEEIEAWRVKNNVPKDLIYLMPEGTTRERIQKATEFLNEVAMKEDYKVSTRLQILVYGDKRAV